MVTVIFPSSFFPLLNSINSLQLLLSFAVVLPSSPTLPRPLLTQSHRIAFSVFLASLFSPLSEHLLSANFSSVILSTYPAHFSLLLTSFFIKLSFIPTILLIQLFSQTCTYSCCLPLKTYLSISPPQVTAFC